MKLTIETLQGPVECFVSDEASPEGWRHVILRTTLTDPALGAVNAVAELLRAGRETLWRTRPEVCEGYSYARFSYSFRSGFERDMPRYEPTYGRIPDTTK